MKLTLFLATLFICMNSFAQEATKIQAGIEVNADNFGSGMKANVGFSDPGYNFNAAYGIGGNFKNVGSIDVEFFNGPITRSKKIRFFYGYSPIAYKSSSLTETLEVFFKVRGGFQVKGTTLTYGYSPLSSFNDRENGEHRAATYQNINFDQQIKNILTITEQVKIGSVSAPEGVKIPRGSYLHSRTEADLHLKKGFTILAYYELEDYDYSKQSDPNIVTGDRTTKEIKNSLRTAGLGVRVNFQ